MQINSENGNRFYSQEEGAVTKFEEGAINIGGSPVIATAPVADYTEPGPAEASPEDPRKLNLPAGHPTITFLTAFFNTPASRRTEAMTNAVLLRLEVLLGPATQLAPQAAPEPMIVRELEVAGDNCAICLEDMLVGESAMVFPCGHMFHDQCTDQWLARKGTCPLCRRRVVEREEEEEEEEEEERTDSDVETDEE